MGVDAQMFVKVPRRIDDTELAQLSYTFGSMCKSWLFMFGHDDTLYSRPLQRIDEYHQDGPTIHPKADETFLNVPLAGKYYGESYERGNLIAYVGIAEFLEALIPDGAVWYGGDSSGVYAERFDHARRAQLLRHAANVAHDPYTMDRPEFTKDKFSGIIEVCPHCTMRMHRDGFGANYALYRCDGCGWEIRHKDGTTQAGHELSDREMADARRI